MLPPLLEPELKLPLLLLDDELLGLLMLELLLFDELLLDLFMLELLLLVLD